LQRAAFIDRDGVVNVERGYVHRIEDFELLPTAPAGLRRLSSDGFALVVVTNQSGIAKGLYDEMQYQRLTRHMQDLLAAEGIALAGVYHCPHDPDGAVAAYARVCGCRKPAPGMMLRAASELGLDLARSCLVGDKTSDTAAGRAAGVRWNVLVRSGHALPQAWRAHADHCCDDLAQAAEWISQRSTEATQ
jgi:D-glycero-D-manno-heptose 1,7-bisphosphate phosphatase